MFGAAEFVASMSTLEGNHPKVAELQSSILEGEQFVVKAAALFIEVAVATSLHKGLVDGKLVNAKCKTALDNVLNMLGCKYEGVKEEDGHVHPLLLAIARDSMEVSSGSATEPQAPVIGS